MARLDILSFIVSIFLSFLLCGCASKDADRVELEYIDSLASNRQHRRAIELLDSIDYRSLSEPNQNLYDLLIIKTRDKDFQKHRSNTVILRLVDYYRNHPKEGKTAEALYYSGRVHFDMGDYPSALRYFQEALDCLEEDHKDKKRLLKVIYVQMADIHNRMRVYDSAIEYVERANQICLQTSDTLGLIQSLELKGAILLHQDSVNQSAKIFHQALSLSTILGQDTLSARIKMYFAKIEHLNDNNQRALSLIRESLKYANENVRGTALGFASEIYLSCGYKDSAYHFASNLIDLRNSRNRKEGYRLIFSPELVHYLPKDSIIPMAIEYGRIMEDFVSLNSDECAKIEHSILNYQLWERKYEQARKIISKRNRLIYLFSILSIVLIGCSLLQYRRYRKSIKEINLLSTRLKLTHQALDVSAANEENYSNTSEDAHLEQQKILRATILRSLSEYETSVPVSKDILDSLTYKTVLAKLQNKRKSGDIKNIWKELEELVNSSSPSFKHRLEILGAGMLDENDQNLALGIKCGITPTQCASLFFVEPSTMTYRRKILARKLFGDEFPLKLLDSAIRLI